MARRALLAFAAYLGVSLPVAGREDHLSTISVAPVYGGTNSAVLGTGDDVHDIHDRLRATESERLLLQLDSNVAGVADFSDLGTMLVQGLPTSEIAVGYRAYFLSAALVANVIIFIYGHRGFAVVFGILTYLSANATIKLAVKWVYLTSHFTFPLFLTALHFASGALASGVFLYGMARPFPWPNQHEFFSMLLPIALSVVVCIGAGNEALSLASAAFTEVISATGCLVTVGMVILMGMPFKLYLIGPTFMVTAGCAISVVGEINFSLVALLCCFCANIARSTKVALQQNLMTGEARSKFGPVPLLFWTCLPSSFVMLAASLAVEGLGPYASMLRTKWQVFLIPVLTSCCVATVLNMAQIIVTKDLGAVGSQLVAQAKTVLTVLGSVAVFGEHVTWVEAFGFASVLLGVFLYTRWDKEDSKKTEATPLYPRTQDNSTTA